MWTMALHRAKRAPDTTRHLRSAGLVTHDTGSDIDSILLRISMYNWNKKKNVLDNGYNYIIIILNLL